jgi:hypothetical protein
MTHGTPTLDANIAFTADDAARHRLPPLGMRLDARGTGMIVIGPEGGGYLSASGPRGTKLRFVVSPCFDELLERDALIRVLLERTRLRARQPGACFGTAVIAGAPRDVGAISGFDGERRVAWAGTYVATPTFGVIVLGEINVGYGVDVSTNTIVRDSRLAPLFERLVIDDALPPTSIGPETAPLPRWRPPSPAMSPFLARRVPQDVPTTAAQPATTSMEGRAHSRPSLVAHGIAYRVTYGDAEAVVRLAIRRRRQRAPLVIEGDTALAQEVRYRIMRDFGIRPKELSSIAGDWLCKWMESPQMADLFPDVIEGESIVDYGGTYAHDDCRKGVELIARWLVSLATSPRDPIWQDGGTYEWEHIVHGHVMMLVYEIAAWRDSWGGTPGVQADLDAAIIAQLAASTATAHYEPSQLVAAFDRATPLGTADRILPEYWRILDAGT